MFCLRSWIPILFFLTNASPIYLLLFITATYILNRPCVYCSLLLGILVISLFDFHNSWFPQPDYSTFNPCHSQQNNTTAHNSTGAACANASSSLSTTSALVAAINSTLEALLNATAEELKKRIPGSVAQTAGLSNSTQTQSVGWIREIISKREWRVPCLDVLVRL